jgi:hypothetical protein
MNEELIKKVIRLKMDAAERALDLLPPEASKKIRTLRNLVYETVGEHLKEGEGGETAKPSGKINHVPID